MSLNILPNMKTVLHCITRDFNFLKRFVGYALEIVEGDKLDAEKVEDLAKSHKLFTIPFIEDIYGLTALHYAMGEETT